MNTDRNEKLFDTMVKAAFEEAVRQEMDSLPGFEKLNEMYPSSKAFDKRIMTIISKEEKLYKRRQAPRQAFKVFTRIAASVAMLFTVSTLVLMSMETSRIFIFNTIMDVQYERPHAAMEFVPFGGEFEFDVIEGPWVYADEEYSIARRSGDMDMDVLDMDVDDIHAGAYIDNDHRDFYVIYINGQEVFLSEALESGGQHIVRWSRGDINFRISANSDNMDIEGLLALAENMIAESE